MSQGYELIFLVLVPASLFDLWQYRIPNVLHGAAIIISLIGHLETQGGYGFIPWFLGILIPFLISYLLYRCHIIGASDSKLFSVIGSFLGVYAVLYIMFLSFFAGAVMAVTKMIVHRNARRRFSYFFYYLIQNKKSNPSNTYYDRKRDGDGGIIPFSVAISFAAIWYLYGMV